MTRSLILATALLMAAPAAFAQCAPTGNPNLDAQCRNFEQWNYRFQQQLQAEREQQQQQQMLLEMQRQRLLLEQQLRQQQMQ